LYVVEVEIYKMGVIYGIALGAADAVRVMAHIAFFVFIKMPVMLEGLVI